MHRCGRAASRTCVCVLGQGGALQFRRVTGLPHNFPFPEKLDRSKINVEQNSLAFWRMRK